MIITPIPYQSICWITIFTNTQSLCLHVIFLLVKINGFSLLISWRVTARKAFCQYEKNKMNLVTLCYILPYPNLNPQQTFEYLKKSDANALVLSHQQDQIYCRLDIILNDTQNLGIINHKISWVIIW